MDSTVPYVTELKALAGLSGALLVLMLMTWYTASLQDSAPLDASAFKGLQLGRLVLGLAAVIVGGAAWWLIVKGHQLLNVRSAVSDLGHLAFGGGALLTIYLIVRVAVPPHYYQVTTYYGATPFGEDSSVQPHVAVHAPAVLALLVMASWTLVGLRLAVAGPDGFSMARCVEVLRDLRNLASGWAKA